MEDVSFTTVFVVTVVAVGSPLVALALPRLRVPAAVIEILAGIVIGPALLDWARADDAVTVLSRFGLAFLLFLAGLEINPSRLRRGLDRVLVGFAVSAGLALATGAALAAAGETRSPLLLGIALSATSLGLVVPVLQDARQTESDFGQLALASCSVAEVASIVLLSLFFSQKSSSTTSSALLLLAFAALTALVALTLWQAGRRIGVAPRFVRMQDTTAQLGIRVALAVLAAFLALAAEFGLETILGAFAAGLLLRAADQRGLVVHESFMSKAQAIGYGFLIPTFFVVSGLTFDGEALFREPRHLLLVPAFLLALLVVRALPAAVFRSELGARRTVALGLLQATSLTFLVVTSHLGTELRLLDAGAGAALVVAGLLSAVLFPAVATSLLDERR